MMLIRAIVDFASAAFVVTVLVPPLMLAGMLGLLEENL